MAYGKIKADAIIRDNGGSDEEITMATIVGLDSSKASLTGATFTGDVTLNAQQELRLADSDSSNYAALRAPATISSNYTLTFPGTDGNASEFLQTDGSGNLSWASISSDNLTDGTKTLDFNSNNLRADTHFVPSVNNTYDLGSSSLRWRDVYTNDLNLSNEGSQNDVDGTWGSWTIQEGEEDLYLLNRRNGKKYKFNLTEV